ncbi:FAD-dependent oxidoreductase [Psychromicrobium sp. YIM B11713]|uniref:FAD-dependent oxidoreductase n=1 Tax=Psychromicrobium sp. YIM B11713 TaxID=3145233 RepID=UPI00374F712E
MTTYFPTVIVGAGLGGLSAAAVLSRHHLPVTVLELEQDRSARTQGGMLDIHQETGQAALEAAGLTDGFRAIVHHGGEAMRIMDRHGVIRYNETDDNSFSRPEVDRGDLRNLFLNALDDSVVQWGRKLVAVRRDENRHRWVLELADGEHLETDLLIGADGAWSRVRPLLSAAAPAYTGISFIEADVVDADARHPQAASAMGQGMLFALGGDTGLLGHRETDGTLHSYLGHRAEEGWIDSIDFTDPEASRAAALELLEGWHEGLRSLIAEAEAPLVARRIHALPVGHSWSRVAGVTLLGDAAHVMSPFAGEGANLAMIDGAELALALIAHPDDAETALSVYETTMFSRAENSARESAESLEVIFAAEAPGSLVEMFEGFQHQQSESA